MTIIGMLGSYMPILSTFAKSSVIVLVVVQCRKCQGQKHRAAMARVLMQSFSGNMEQQVHPSSCSSRWSHKIATDADTRATVCRLRCVSLHSFGHNL